MSVNAVSIHSGKMDGHGKWTRAKAEDKSENLQVIHSEWTLYYSMAMGSFIFSWGRYEDHHTVFKVPEDY